MPEFSAYNVSGSEDFIYEGAFGKYPNETLIEARYLGIDERNLQKGYLEKQITAHLAKANSLTSLTTPTWIDQAIEDRTIRERPAYALLPKVTNRGKTAVYNARTARGAAAFKAEGASQADADDTYANNSTDIKFAYSVGGVTGPAQAANRGYVDFFAETVRSHQESLEDLLEQTILTGNASTNALEFDGFQQLITTNTTNMSSTQIDLDTIGLALDASKEYGNGRKVMFTDFTTLRRIKSQMMADVGYVNPSDSLAWGLTAVQYENIPIIGDRFMPTTTNAKELYIVDLDVTEIRMLQPPTMEMLAHTMDAERFMIKTYQAMIIKNEKRCARIYGIA